MSQSPWKTLLEKFSHKRSAVQRGVSYHRGRLTVELLEERVNPSPGVTISGPTTFPAGTGISITTQELDTTISGTDELDITSNGSIIFADRFTGNSNSNQFDYLVKQSSETIDASFTNFNSNKSATVAISVIPTVQFGSFTGSANAFSIPVTLAGPAPTTAVTVPFDVSGTAVEGTDFSGVTASPLTFAPGQTVANITGTTITNASATSPPTIVFTLTTPTSNAILANGNTVETVTITEPTVPPPPTIGSAIQYLSSTVKAELKSLSSYFSGLAVDLGVDAGTALFNGDSSGAAFYGAGAALCTYVSSQLSTLAADPPDSNFTTVAQPVIPSLTPVAAGGTVTPAEANASNALYTNLEEQIGLGGAISTAINRASTAASAGDIASEQLQIAGGSGFASQLSSFVAAEPALLTNLQTALTAAGVSQTITASQVSTYQSNLKTNGLPTAVSTALTQLGLSTAEINTATGVLETLDPNQVAGSFPGALTNPTFLSQLQSTANGLQTGLISKIDELGSYRPSDGSWSLDSDGTTGFGPNDQIFFSFSPANVIGVVGDWTGAGHTNIGDFNNGVWHLDLNGNGQVDANETFQFGQAGDQPVVGDWDGNASGRSELGVFRGTGDAANSGEFILDTNNDKIIDAGDTTFIFGLATDKIIVGDWTGTGKTKVGVYRDAVNFNSTDAGDIVFSENTSDTDPSVFTNFVFGLITDKVVIGDWNGSGTAKVAVYRDASSVPLGNALHAPGTAIFSEDFTGALDFSKDGKIFLFGLSSDQFVSGHWALTPPLQPNGLAQFAANGPGLGGASALTEAQLQPVLNQAIAAWAADGASVSQLEAARVQIGTLDDNLIGETSGNQITIDATADGWGWNTDTSGTDFTTTGFNGLQATAGSAAAGEMDLLTVVEHEYGHILGLTHVNPLTQPSSLMASTLPVGVRRSPTAVADAVFATSLS